MSTVRNLLQRRTLIAGVLIAGMVGATAVGISSTSLGDATHTTHPPARHASSPGTKASAEPVSFSHLSKQHSNNCTLLAAELVAFPSKMRLQGACCQKMDAESYKGQLDGLRQYSAIPQIPANPYDVSALLARQLIRYHATIHLTSAEYATYHRGMQLSPEHGPCCCHCWRWSAFQGLSDYLIADRGWTAKPLGHLIGLLDGCGGGKTASGSKTRSQMRGM